MVDAATAQQIVSETAPPDDGTATPAPSSSPAVSEPQGDLDFHQRQAILQQAAQGKLNYTPPKEGTYGGSEQKSEVSPWVSGPMGMINQLLGAFQKSSPVTRDSQGNLLYKPVGTLTQADWGDAISTPDNKLMELDPTKHVVFYDEKTGVPTVYERNPQSEESLPTSFGRLLGVGTLSAAPVEAAASEAPGAADRLADFEKAGIPPNLPAVTQSRALGTVAKTLGDVPFVGSPIAAGAKRTASAAEQSLERIAQGYGSAGTPEEGGQALQSGVQAFKGERGAAPSITDAMTTPTRDAGFQNKAEALYNAVPISGDTPVDLTGTADALKGISSKFPTNPQLGQTLQPSTFKKWLDALSSSDNKLSWDELKQFRSYVGRNMRRPPGELGLGPDDMRNLYGALSEDMQKAATDAGPDAVKAFNRANSYYSAGLDRIKSALDFIDKADSPEKAYYGLTKMASQRGQGADINTFAQVMKSLPAEQKGDVAATVLRRLGMPVKSQAGEGANFSGNTFTSNYADLAPRAKDILFGPEGTEGRDTLEAFSRTMSHLKNVERLGNPSGTFREAITASSGVGLYERPIETLTSMALAYGGAKALMSPAITKWLTQASVALGRSTPQWPTYLARLRVLTSAYPELKPMYDRLTATATP